MTRRRGDRLFPRAGRPPRPPAGHLQRPLDLQPARASSTCASSPSIPRIVGCKDVCPSLSRTLDWPVAERRRLGFSYLHGTDLVGLSTELGADGFVTSLANPFPELAVAIWDAAREGRRRAGVPAPGRSSPGWPGSPGSARCSPAWRPPAGIAGCSSGCSPPRSARSTPRPPAGWSRWSSRSASCPKRPRAASLRSESTAETGGDTARRFVKVRRRYRRRARDEPRARRIGTGPAATAFPDGRDAGRIRKEEQGAWRLTLRFARRARGRRPAAIALALVPGLAGASHRTTNFVVEAPTAEVARKVAEQAEACRASIAQAVARPGAPRLGHALPDPGQADPGRGRRPDLVRVQSGPGLRPGHDGRGAARPDPRLGAAARGHAHRLRRLLRRPDAPLGRRGGLAPERGPPRAAAATTRSSSTCSPDAATSRSPASSRSRNTPAT